MRTFNRIFNFLLLAMAALSILYFLDFKVLYHEWLMAFLIIICSVMFFLRAIRMRRDK
jgi:hypothetical protein